MRKKSTLFFTAKMLTMLFAVLLMVSANAFAVTVSIPAVTGDVGATYDIPVNIDDATGVAGYQFAVTYDPAVLNCTTALKGSLTGTFDTPTNNITSGQVATLSIGPTLASGSGSLAIIQCTVMGTAGANTSLHFMPFPNTDITDELGDSIPATYVDGTFTINGGCVPGAGVCDGSFEAGTPNPFWAEASTNFGTPLSFCEGCGGQSAAPRTGSWWAWFGGVAGATETGSLSQSVTIPSGVVPTLQFYLWIGASSGNGADFLKAKIDGSEIFSVTEGDPSYTAGYAPVSIDLSAYADGGVHALAFESTTTGEAVSNFFVDDVSITEVACTPEPEVCDGQDNDCDGQVDEELTRPTTCGAGACSSTGIETCTMGVWGGDTCTPGNPVAETCNNIDDDCDGQVDEGVTRPTTCGVGACSSTGIETCTMGVWGGDTCTPGSPAAETCNAIDDDCDGTVDDGLSCTAPEMSVAPSAPVDFGNINVGSLSTQEFLISNTGTANLTVDSIGFTGGDSGMFSLKTGGTNPCPNLTPAIAAGGSCTVIVKFKPSTEGAKSTTFRIVSNASDSPTLDVALSGTGTIQPVFSDCPSGSFAEDFINTLFYRGVTGGCGNGSFCPDSPVTRAQMAVFLLTAMGEQPAATCTGAFADVNVDAPGDAFCRYIDRFSTLGISGGCGNGNFCPNDTVTRAQMAVFMTTALHQVPEASCNETFNDVNVGSGDLFCRYIEKFATLGITGGCGNGNYCPNDPVTRAQMAVFLTTGFLQ